jgi:hypothetical protein
MEIERICAILNSDGLSGDLTIRFLAPIESVEFGGYMAEVLIISPFFEKIVRVYGEDTVQAFFSLPAAAMGFLMGKKREGYKIYWLEASDLDLPDFWAYK